jgi:hypothetical protein
LRQDTHEDSYTATQAAVARNANQDLQPSSAANTNPLHMAAAALIKNLLVEANTKAECECQLKVIEHR